MACYLRFADQPMQLTGQTSEARSGMLGTEAAAGVVMNLEERSGASVRRVRVAIHARDVH